MGRWTIRKTLIAVGLIAFGLAAFRSGSGTLANLLLWVFHLFILVATLAAIVRCPPKASWVGFAVVGSSVFAWTDFYAQGKVNLPTERLIYRLARSIHSLPNVPPGSALTFDERTWNYYWTGMPGVEFGSTKADEIRARVGRYNEQVAGSAYMGQILFAILLTGLGAVVGLLLARAQPSPSRSRVRQKNDAVRALPRPGERDRLASAGKSSHSISLLDWRDSGMRGRAIATALIAVGLLFLGFVAFRSGSRVAADVLFWICYFALVLATLGAIVRRPQAAPWAGFAVFGWSIFVWLDWYELRDVHLPTDSFMWEIARRAHPLPVLPPGLDYSFDGGQWRFHSPSSPKLPAPVMEEIGKNVEAINERIDGSRRIGHILSTILFASLGAILGPLLVRRSKPPVPSPTIRVE